MNFGPQEERVVLRGCFHSFGAKRGLPLRVGFHFLASRSPQGYGLRSRDFRFRFAGFRVQGSS